ncbi:hypothetical protein V6N13_128163 [Hibiscus sabdariffa]|uniref:Uncharacterized protein n=1 Tax=Hibiscus sabdariffa TaxID=183260 RepID=A0ABR2P212_9ROSI
MKGRLETEFDVDSSSEDDKDSEVGKRGKNMVEEDDSNWPLDYFEQHSIRNVGNTQLEDFQRAREGNPFQVYQNAKDRLPPRRIGNVLIDLKYVPQLCDVSYAGQWESRRVFELRESIPSCLVTSQSVNLSLRIPFLPIVIS